MGLKLLLQSRSVMVTFEEGLCYLCCTVSEKPKIELIQHTTITSYCSEEEKGRFSGLPGRVYFYIEPSQKKTDFGGNTNHVGTPSRGSLRV